MHISAARLPAPRVFADLDECACCLVATRSLLLVLARETLTKPKTVDYFHKICLSPSRTPASIHTSDARLWPPRVFADFGDGASCVVAHRSLLVPARQAKIIEIELSRARMPVSTTQICNGNIGRVLHDHLNAVVQASRPDSAF